MVYGVTYDFMNCCLTFFRRSSMVFEASFAALANSSKAIVTTPTVKRKILLSSFIDQCSLLEFSPRILYDALRRKYYSMMPRECQVVMGELSAFCWIEDHPVFLTRMGFSTILIFVYEFTGRVKEEVRLKCPVFIPDQSRLKDESSGVIYGHFPGYTTVLRMRGGIDG